MSTHIIMPWRVRKEGMLSNWIVKNDPILQAVVCGNGDMFNVYVSGRVVSIIIGYSIMSTEWLLETVEKHTRGIAWWDVNRVCFVLVKRALSTDTMHSLSLSLSNFRWRLDEDGEGFQGWQDRLAAASGLLCRTFPPPRNDPSGGTRPRGCQLQLPPATFHNSTLHNDQKTLEYILFELDFLVFT